MTHFPKERDACVLLSGGIDSAACLDLLLSQGFCVEAIHIDYQQPAAKHERRAAISLSAHYGVPLRICTWLTERPKSAGEIIGRNAFLLFAAAMEIGDRNGLLATGLHSGTPYYDCSESFLSALQYILDGYADGRLRVVAPFLTWNKSDIWAFCTARRVPIPLTYSCENCGDEPCGKCPSCRDRRVLDASNSHINNPPQTVRREP